MKQTIILIILTISLISCKKENLHKIKYQIKFLELPDWYHSNYLEVTASPCYIGEYNYSRDENGTIILPNIDYDQAKDGLWEYEYWELKDNSRVLFMLLAKIDYHYELRVFIDGKQVSYKRVKTSDQQYFHAIEIEGNGLDNDPKSDYIEFTYKE